MRTPAILALALLLSQEASSPRAKAESAFALQQSPLQGFADEGLKLADEFLKKGAFPEARFLSGLVGSRVPAAKETADLFIEAAKLGQVKPATKEVEAKVAAFGKKWAAEWRKAKGADAARLGVEAEILDALGEHAKAYALFNRRRAEAGVGEVDYDFGLAHGCQRHAKYLAQHPDAADPHTEEAGKAGFSQEGKKAAENSVVGGGPSLSIEIDAQLATLYHRIRMIDPSTLRVGMGLATDSRNLKTTVIDQSSATSDGESLLKWIVYPPDKASDVFLQMQPENPVPVPPDVETKVGYPVTLCFFDGEAEITNVKAKLTEVSSKREVNCFESSPEKPANGKADHNWGIVGLIPKSALNKNSVYRATFECTFRGERLNKEWTFTTGMKVRPD